MKTTENLNSLSQLNFSRINWERQQLDFLLFTLKKPFFPFLFPHSALLDWHQSGSAVLTLALYVGK